MVKITLYMNSKIKNPQMKHCLYLKYGIIYRPEMGKLQVRKKHLKNEKELKVTFQNKPLLNILQY